MTEPTAIEERLQVFADEVGGTFRSEQYDAGTQYTLVIPGKGSATVDIDWVDDIDPVEALRQRAVALGLLGGIRHQYRLTYASGTTLTIWATTEEQATKLAGRGSPEKVEVV